MVGAVGRVTFTSPSVAGQDAEPGLLPTPLCSPPWGSASFLLLQLPPPPPPVDDDIPPTTGPPPSLPPLFPPSSPFPLASRGRPTAGRPFPPLPSPPAPPVHQHPPVPFPPPRDDLLSSLPVGPDLEGRAPLGRPLAACPLLPFSLGPRLAGHVITVPGTSSPPAHRPFCALRSPGSFLPAPPRDICPAPRTVLLPCSLIWSILPIPPCGPSSSSARCCPPPRCRSADEFA